MADQRCVACGGTNLSEVDGAMVCMDCGTQAEVSVLRLLANAETAAQAHAHCGRYQEPTAGSAHVPTYAIKLFCSQVASPQRKQSPQASCAHNRAELPVAATIPAFSFQLPRQQTSACAVVCCVCAGSI